MSSVQVVVPCYNYGRYLRACVASALDQPGVDVSVLIVDDQSSDDTPDICRALAAADRRVSFVRHVINMGHIATYNDGLARVTAKYVVLLSADDLLTPGALGRAVALMEAHPAVGLVYGHPVSFSGLLPPRPRLGKVTWTVWEGQTWLDMMCRTGRNFIVCPEVVMRTSVQRRIGGYEAALPHSGDMEMWMRAAAVADIGHIVGADQALYRVHPLSMQRTVNAGLLIDLRAREAAFRSALTRSELAVPGAETLLAAARRALALSALAFVSQCYRGSEGLDEPLEAYRSLARELLPDVVTLPIWRETERFHARRLPMPPLLVRRIARFCTRLGRRRWRHTGVYRSY